MKNKPIFIVYFVFFALAIPIALLGYGMTFMWLAEASASKAMFLEIFLAIVGMVISATYAVSYFISLSKTRKAKKFSALSFLPVIHCAVAVIYLLSLSPAEKYINDHREYLGFAKNDYTVICETDTHGGLMGDGSYFLALDCSQNVEKASTAVSSWNKLSLSENIGILLYGGEKDGKYMSHNIAKEFEIPKIENGYYYFKDRHSESVDPFDDCALFDRKSFNFTLALFDTDTAMFYYIVYDT